MRASLDISGLNTSIKLPGDPGWDEQRRAWNLSVDQHPAAVVHPKSVTGIVEAVRFARDHGLAAAAQPRGHGATTALDGTVLVRTGALDELAVDVDRRIARVGPGVRWQQLNEALTGTRLTGLPGSSSDPTVVGYTLGGGLSWFGRMHGLASGRIRAAELVDAEGNHRRVTEDSDPDLFWALRGGGGDFGIVTALELDLLPAGQLYGGRLTWPVRHARAVLAVYHELSETAPDRLTPWVWLLNPPDAERQVAVGVTYLGDAAGAEALLAPLRAVAVPETDSLGPMPLSALLDPDSAGRPVAAIAAAHGFTSASHFSRVFRDRYGLPPAEFRIAYAGTPSSASATAPLNWALYSRA